MKNLKKIIALSLSLIMLLTLCSCQANTNKKFFELLGEANAFKTGSFTSEITVETEVEKEMIEELRDTFGVELDSTKMSFNIKVDGQIDSDKNELCANLSIALDGKYVDLTTLVMKDNKVYMNVHQLVNSLLNIKVIREAISNEGSEELYNMIVDNINEMFKGKEFIVVEPDDAKIDNFNFGTYANVVKDSGFYKGLWNMMKDTITGFEPAVITKEKGTYTMTLTTDNTKVVNDKTTEFVKSNGELAYTFFHDLAVANNAQLGMMVFNLINDSFYGDFNTYPETNEEAIKLIEENKADIIEGIKNSTDTTVSNDTQGVMTVSVTKEKNTITTAIGVKTDEATMQIKTVSTSGATDIKAPDNAVTLEELMTSIEANDFFGAMMGGMGDVGFDNDDDYTYDWPDDNDPTTIGDDEWKWEEDIDISEVKNEVVANGIKEYMAKLETNGFEEIKIDYSYGSYEVSGRQDNQYVIVEFDPNYGNKDNDYLYSINFTLDADTKAVDRNAFVKSTGDMFTTIFGIDVPYDDVITTLDDPESQYASGYLRGTVYNSDGSNFAVGFDSNEDYESFTPQCSIAYYFAN